MPLQELMLAENDTTGLWHRAVLEGERRAGISLGPMLEEHLTMTLRSYLKDTELCAVVAREFLETYALYDSEALIRVAGRCLLIAGFFPELSRRRNVRIGYFFEMGVGAYRAHAGYWQARRRTSYAKASRSAAERFADLVKTLRGMKNSELLAEELQATKISPLEWH
ncbi:MAG: hypothetical protein WBL19_02475 [Minisyncoccia bacterium]